MDADEFDLEVFIANLAARLVGNSISNTQHVEFNWRSKMLSTTDCAFIDITIQPGKARFGSLYYSETGSVYHTAEPLTEQVIQAHFGEQVDTQNTKAEVLAKLIANTLLNNSIRASSEGVYLMYDGFCGERKLLCKGAEVANLPQFATKMVVLGGQQHQSPENLAEETIASISESLISRWRTDITPPSCKASVSEALSSGAAEISEHPPKSLGDNSSEIEQPSIMDKKQPAEPSAPQREPAKKKRSNVKSRVKKKKKRSGALRLMDES